MSERLTSGQWTRYWQNGTVTTFIDRFERNYDGEIGDFWQAQFSALPSEAALVDLATGNGALALLAAEYAVAKGFDWRITGIDFAEIDPANLVAAKYPAEVMQKISFVPHTAIEATGLPSHAFDLAMSQFGIEYAEPGAAIAEVGRLLQGAGRFAAMMHCKGSVLDQQAEDGIQQADVCLGSGLHPQLGQLVKRVDALRLKSKDPAKDRKAEALREGVNGITESLHKAMQQHEDPRQLAYFLENSMAVFRSHFKGSSTDEKLEFLRQVGEETLAYQQRMADLHLAARPAEDIALMESALALEGFSLTESARLHIEGEDFCHKLVAARPVANAT